MNFVLTEEQIDEKELKIKKYKLKHRKQKITINFLLVPVIMILFCLMIQMFVNYEQFIYLNNEQNYAKATGTIIEETTDELTLLIPKATIKYKYENVEYECNKYFFIEKLFNIKQSKNDTINIYINKLAPNYCISNLDFYDSKVNIITMAVIIFCLLDMLIKFIHNIKYYKQNKYFKKKKKHKKEIKKAIRKMYKVGEKNGEKRKEESKN